MQLVSSQVDKLKNKLNFAVSSVSEFASELQEYGLGDTDNKKPVATIRDEKMRKYVMKDEFSVENLQKFVSDYLEGALEPYLKSEPIPEDEYVSSVIVTVKLWWLSDLHALLLQLVCRQGGCRKELRPDRQ